MAVGDSSTRLRDRQLAEDAAQEAFVTAYFAFASLREPAAFPGWFRRIVIKQIDRIQRKHRPTVALDHLVYNDEHGYQASKYLREVYLNFTTSIFSPTASLDDPCVEIQYLYDTIPSSE